MHAIAFRFPPLSVRLLDESVRGLNQAGVQHLLHLKSKSKILRPIEIMGFFYEFFCQIQGNNLL